MKKGKVLEIAMLIVIFAAIISAVLCALFIPNKIQLYNLVLLAVLVGVTTVVAYSAIRQAEASMKMAEEMREQRRPIVVQKVVPFVPVENTPRRTIEGVQYVVPIGPIGPIEIVSDYFKVCNEGYGPAIELEILLLDKEKRKLNGQRETFFSLVERSPLEFHPKGLSDHINSTCYLLCRYRGVVSPDKGQIWYETWLPFESAKSQRGDRIIITPGELEFHVTFEKKSY